MGRRHWSPTWATLKSYCWFMFLTDSVSNGKKIIIIIIWDVINPSLAPSRHQSGRRKQQLCYTWFQLAPFLLVSSSEPSGGDSRSCLCVQKMLQRLRHTTPKTLKMCADKHKDTRTSAHAHIHTYRFTQDKWRNNCEELQMKRVWGLLWISFV